MPSLYFQSQSNRVFATVAGGLATTKSASPAPPANVTVTGEPLLASPPNPPSAQMSAEVRPGTAAKRTRTEWLPPITQAAGLTACPAETYSGAATFAPAP